MIYLFVIFSAALVSANPNRWWETDPNKRCTVPNLSGISKRDPMNTSSNNYRIRVGSEKLDGGDVYEVKNIILHPNFTVISEAPAHGDNDIAFVVTEQHFNFSDTVKPIAFDQNEPQPNDDVRVTGWGRIAPGGNVSQYLQQLNLTIADRPTCEKELSSRNVINPQTMICAGPIEEGTDPCNGDSGGPLVGNGELVGLVSFGGLCQDPNYKTVAFTNVANFYDWILQQIANVS